MQNETMSWQQRQHVFFLTSGQKWEWHAPDVVVSDPLEIKEAAIFYFLHDFKDLIYPSKSLSVAYIYARSIQKHFEPDRSITDILSEPGLLYFNDPFFRPYSDDTKECYDAIIEQVGDDYLKTKQAQKTYQCFLEEMLLDVLSDN